jgi:hypothetical protein
VNRYAKANPLSVRATEPVATQGTANVCAAGLERGGARRTSCYASSDGVNQHLAWVEDLVWVLSLHPAVAITELFQIAASILQVFAADGAEPFEIV